MRTVSKIDVSLYLISATYFSIFLCKYSSFRWRKVTDFSTGTWVSIINVDKFESEGRKKPAYSTNGITYRCRQYRYDTIRYDVSSSISSQWRDDVPRARKAMFCCDALYMVAQNKTLDSCFRITHVKKFISIFRSLWSVGFFEKLVCIRYLKKLSPQLKYANALHSESYTSSLKAK